MQMQKMQKVKCSNTQKAATPSSFDVRTAAFLYLM
jgi:hypothetical protein